MGGVTHARARDAAASAAAAYDGNALARARAVADPWYRAQALAAVAWYARDEWMRIAREAVAAAEACTDAYGRAAVRAWPLRVLIDRGGPAAAAPVFDHALREAAQIAHPVSRVDALALLLHSTAPYDAGMRERAAAALAGAARVSASWKGAWHMRNAALMVGRWDPGLALRMAASMPPGRHRRQAEIGVAAAEWEPPRWFFDPR
jgi:hypothetical protein